MQIICRLKGTLFTWFKWTSVMSDSHSHLLNPCLADQEGMRNQCLFSRKLIIFHGGLSLKGIFGFMMLKEWRKLTQWNTLYDRKTTISSSLLHRTCHSINGGSPKTMSIVSLHELFLKLTFFLDFLNSYSRAPSAEYRKQVLHVVSACLETNIQRWCFV